MFVNQTHKYKNHVLAVRDFFIDLLFPIRCLSCGKEDTWLCSTCQKEIPIKKSFDCSVCKKPSQNGAIHLSCQTKTELSGLWISSSYHSPLLVKLIKQYKYYFCKGLSLPLSNIMIDFLKQNKLADQLFFSKNTIIIPVPLHKRRQKFRGFNQAELLARHIAKHYNIEVNTNLKRIKNTKAQAKLTKKQREENVKGVFAWIGNDLKNKNIILIDDVASTNSTLNNCAKVLNDRGASSVWGFVIAKNN